MGRGEKVDYRISMLVVLCKDCNQDVGLYPARHQCQVERPPLPPLPPLPTNKPETISPPPVSLLRKASSPALSRLGSTRQPSPSITDSPVTRAQSTSRWSPSSSSRFGRSANNKNTSPAEEKQDDDPVDYFDHFSAHLPSTDPSPSLKKKWGGSLRQNEKWKQLNDKADQQKQQQSNPKFWKRLVRATQNMTVQDDQGPESDESDWEGESHVSRILRQYHEKKHPSPLPSWLLDDKRSTIPYSTTKEDKAIKLLDRQNSRRRLWDANTEPSARDLELESLRQDHYNHPSQPRHSHRTSGRHSRPTAMLDSDHSDDVDDTQRRSPSFINHEPRPDEQHYIHRKNKRLERMQSARRCMEDQYLDVENQPPRQSKVDDILAHARQAALSRSRSDRALDSTYRHSETTATEITPSNYRSYMNHQKQDKSLDDLTFKNPKQQRYLVPERRDGLGLF